MPRARRSDRAGAGARLSALWTAVLTLLWAAPLIAFAALHLGHPPPLPALAAMTALVAAAATRRWIPARWFSPARWESQRFYRAAGVRAFGRIVPEGAVLTKLEGRRRRAGQSPAPSGAALASLGASATGRVATARARAQLEAATRDSEQTHLAWLLRTLAFVLWAVAIGRTRFAGLLLLANLPLNVYPILLQRDTRARLQRVAAWRARQGAASRNPRKA
jgi:hypothetical protein